MREGKGDKQKRNGDSDTPGALFPRLHVKETRNNGPRAPPRNKMALYEQLTIPSHRFEQQQFSTQQQQQQNMTPQAQPVPQAFLPQSYTGGYYLPYYMTPPMAFQSMNVVMGQQPMLNPANYDMECDQGELQRVPGGANNEHLMRVTSLQSKNVLTRNSDTRNSDSKKVMQKEYQEDFAVPTYSSKAKGSASSSIANSTVSTAEEQSQASKQAGKNIPSLVRTAGSHNLERPRAEAHFNLQRPQRTGLDNDVVNETTLRGNETRLRDDGFRFRGDEAQAHNQSPSRSFDSNGGLDNQSDEEGVEQEEVETSDDSAQSVLDNTAAPNVSSKDVMTAVGDDRFWKMRKAMQRQQRIFHKQLFELHRLTKVQHLMAASGIDDDADTDTPQEEEEKNAEVNREVQEDSLKIPESQTEDKQANNLVSREEDFDSPQPSKLPEIQQHDYSRYPPTMNNMGFPPFSGFPQWYGPVPVQFPPSFPGVYNMPYGPMLSGPPPSYMPCGIERRPYVPYNCEQRSNMMPQWQQGYYPEAGVQWMGGLGYMNPLGQSMGTFKENSQNQTGAASSSSQSRHLHSSQAGSTAGFVPPRPDSRQQPQPQHQQKLVGKYVEGKDAGSSKSPYLRPAGFHVFNSGSNGEKTGKVIKVTPKAAMVTAESAAEILQSIRQERPER